MPFSLTRRLARALARRLTSALARRPAAALARIAPRPARSLAPALAILTACSSVSAAASCGGPDRPLISEVLYDPLGNDAGLEFVELFNPTGVPRPLAGVRLEAGDGAGPGRWSVRWTGTAADTIAAHARFVIGAAGVTPPPDAVARLDLQNGPDAVRLVWPDGVTEVVGYGALELLEYFCGAPAADVPSGMALARIPDGAWNGSNALDFRAAPPTPGRANQPGRDAALVAGTIRLAPELPDPGVPARVSVVIASRGAMGFAAGDIELGFSFGGAPLAARALDAALAASETTRVEIPVTFGSAGSGMLVARLRAAADEDSTDDADSLRVRIGPGPLEVTEIQFHPARGEGEWVEVRNRTRAPLDLADFLVGDRNGARGAVRGPAGTTALAAGAYAVLAQDRGAMLNAYARLDTSRVFGVSPWAALNNSDDASGVADIVTVRERDGTPCAAVPFRAAGIPGGVPIEIDQNGAWGPSSDPAGTPLSPPAALPVLARPFAVTPHRVRAGAALLRIAWSLPWPAARLEVTAYDLAGRRAAVVLPSAEAFARGARAWDASRLPPGLYVLALAARSASGAAIGAREALRVTGIEP